MYLHRFLLLLIPAVYILIPWWSDFIASLTLHWVLPFAAWGVAIALAFTVDRNRG